MSELLFHSTFADAHGLKLKPFFSLLLLDSFITSPRQKSFWEEESEVCHECPTFVQSGTEDHSNTCKHVKEARSFFLFRVPTTNMGPRRSDAVHTGHGRWPSADRSGGRPSNARSSLAGHLAPNPLAFRLSSGFPTGLHGSQHRPSQPKAVFPMSASESTLAELSEWDLLEQSSASDWDV